MATHRKTMVRTVAGLALIALLSLTGLVQAKIIPYVEPLDGDWGDFNNYPIMTLEESYFSGVYGRLGEPGDADVIHMRFDQPAGEVTLDLLVPVCGDHFTDFYPTLALIGPDQDMSEDTLAALPFELPEGLGAQILGPERPTENEDGPRVPASEWQLFEQSYYEPLRITFAVATPAKYFFAVWDDTEATGAYTLLTGVEHPRPGVLDAEAMEDAFELISSGAWIGWDCDAEAEVDADADAATDA